MGPKPLSSRRGADVRIVTIVVFPCQEIKTSFLFLDKHANITGFTMESSGHKVPLPVKCHYQLSEEPRTARPFPGKRPIPVPARARSFAGAHLPPYGLTGEPLDNSGTSTLVEERIP